MLTTLKEILLTGTGLSAAGPAHEAPLAVPSWFNWQTMANASSWGLAGQSNTDHMEWRGAVMPEYGIWPTDEFFVEICNPQTFWRGPDWEEFHNLNLNTGNGGYLGDVTTPEVNPFTNSGGGNVWTTVGTDHVRSPWRPQHTALHFWGGDKKLMPAGYTAEMGCGLIRLQPGANGYLPQQVAGRPGFYHMLGGIGLDYYAETNQNNNSAPGPGIQHYRYLSTDWQPFGWITAAAPVPWDRTAVSNWIDTVGLPEPDMMARLDLVVEPPASGNVRCVVVG